MKRFKNWLKNKLRDWLEINAMDEKIDLTEARLRKRLHATQCDLYQQISELDIKIKLLEKELDLFKSMCDVGVDVHMKTDSWAVVCLEGKQEYVNFVRLDSRDARDVKHFLKRFEKSNRRIDAPYGMMDCFKW